MSRAGKVLIAAGAMLGVALLAIPALMMTAFIGTNTSGGGSGGGNWAASSNCVLSASTVTVEDLDEEQISNARTIVAVGKSLKVPPRGWVIAIATALQESGLRNLDYGDRDSLGLMQQRPSAGWGTPAQVQDPAYAARAFFGGQSSPTRNAGLVSVPGWERMPLWEAAQTVQRSAFPMAYADHEPLATEIVERLSGTTAGCEPLSSGPWRSPVEVGYNLTSSYGWRTSPTQGGADFHTGQDFARREGSPVSAVAQGVVVFADWGGSYGNLVRLRHANGVESWYAHLSVVDATVGDRVRAGDHIGAVGSTGNSTGPHLHLEVRVDDQPTDPLPWLAQKGVRL
jgi:murein DD-endopeptidase MepM/ murein hydrolase activator NlpD